MTRQWILLAVRVFLAMGGGFGLVYGLVNHSARHGLSGGIFFGLFMSIMVTVITTARTGRRPGNLGTRQHETLTVPADPSVVHARALEGLSRLDARVLHSSANEIRARAPVSWESWGERMTITITGDTAASRVDISSRPRIPTTLFDYGRNRKNIEHLIAWINQPIATEPPAPNPPARKPP